jgi:hypothetical protein
MDATHEVGDDPMPRRRVRISGPIYDDSNVPLLRVEYEDGAAELAGRSELLPPSSGTGLLLEALLPFGSAPHLWAARRRPLSFASRNTARPL